MMVADSLSALVSHRPCVPIQNSLRKFYARKTESLSKLTLHHGYEYLGHGEYYAGVRSGLERVLRATEAFVFMLHFNPSWGACYQSRYSGLKELMPGILKTRCSSTNSQRRYLILKCNM